jgi:hypothetical protein
MADSVVVHLDVTIWEAMEQQPNGRFPWEWEVTVAGGRSTEGKCATRPEAIDRAVRQVGVEVESARA